MKSEKYVADLKQKARRILVGSSIPNNGIHRSNIAFF
jgi:hypothetical protein